MELLPLRINEQILDAISGFIPPELASRIAFCKNNTGKVLTINGSKAYNVAVENDNIYYTLKPASKKIYYYPIQYAKIVFRD